MAVSLAIAACGPQLEVALAADPTGVASLVRLAGVSPRSTLLLAAVDLLAEDAGLAPEEIARVVVSRGPGSFTGIRAGLATAAGLAAASGCEPWAYDSLTTQAARCSLTGVVWAAQPGRRGEVYARPFRVEPLRAPEPMGGIEILALTDLSGRGPWTAAERLDLGTAERVAPVRSAAEALLELARLGVPSDAVEPLFVEGPPVHREQADG
jgi:tRNA threonylcarbamoyl adenosine modification protein YeaZ